MIRPDNDHGDMNTTIKLASGFTTLLAAALTADFVWATQNAAGKSETASPLAGRVIVVENADSPVSVRIARHYMKQRGVTKIFQVHCQDSALETGKETIPFADFKDKIETPLKAFLAKDQTIDFIVLTKGIPIRLSDAPVGVSGKQPSLDSYLAALDYFDRKDTIPIQLNDSGFTGKCFANRFWNSHERFSHAKFGGYLVTRLDGYTAEQAMRLTNSAIKAEKSPPQGSILLDIVHSHGLTNLDAVPLSPIKDGTLDLKMVNEMPYNEWDTDLTVAGMNLEKANQPVLVDNTDEFIGKKSGLMGYASWGSNDPKFVAENYVSLRFSPGAIAETAVSTSARTFLPTSGGQSLIADLVVSGVTGVKGYCDEPLLQAVASPTILFDRYTKGWTLAESFYAASRFVGWEDIVIGDPLCAPYALKK